MFIGWGPLLGVSRYVCPHGTYDDMYSPMWQFWDSGGVKLESLSNFSIVGCQWTVNCLLGMSR